MAPYFQRVRLAVLARQRHERVLHSQYGLAVDAQVKVHEQIIRLVDAAGLRVLHRQHAVRGLARLDRGKQILERLARQRRHGVAEVLEDGLLAVRAVLALERDLARHLGAVLAVLADGGGVAPQLSSFWCSTQRSERVRRRSDDDDHDAPQAAAAAIAAHYGCLKRRCTTRGPNEATLASAAAASVN